MQWTVANRTKMATANDVAAARAAAAAVCTPSTRGFRWPGYAGNNTVQRKADFFAIPSHDDDSVTRRNAYGAHGATMSATDAAALAVGRGSSAKRASSSSTRDGAHVGHLRGNALEQAPLDPLAERQLKIRDPVAYHVYCNQRPWVTQSTLIGEHLRSPTSPLHGTGAIASPMGATKRDALQALRRASPRAIGENHRPGDMEAVSATRVGYVPAPPRQQGDMASTAQVTYINVRELPEPATCKTRSFHSKPFFQRHPVDPSAHDAVDAMWQPDGSLSASRPEKVHPSVWDLVNKRDKAASLGDPHAHKRRPLWNPANSGTAVATA